MIVHVYYIYINNRAKFTIPVSFEKKVSFIIYHFIEEFTPRTSYSNLEDHSVIVSDSTLCLYSICVLSIVFVVGTRSWIGLQSLM